MIDETYKIKGYYPTIGIECHVQLKTKTKLFAGIDNDARFAEPNTLISHICLGMPGALPVLNHEAVTLACRAAFALSTEPQMFSKFDRKHYFYPDLPMGYQITQFDQPIILGGKVSTSVQGVKKEFTITRAHLEADAGKSTHPTGKDYSLVDLNRAGTPLLEIVSDPCMHSAEEAKAYAQELYLLMKHAGVSDVNLFYGNMRFDVNVSVSKDPQIFGTRTETKNLNSFRSVYDAVVYEINRQIEVLENGGKIEQETRGWLDDAGKTFSQRSKEDAHDYRYFPDPDLPPIVLDESTVDAIAANMPALPDEVRQLFTAAGIEPSVIETVLDELQASEILLNVQKMSSAPVTKIIGNWLGGPIQKLLSEEKITWQQVAETTNYLITLAEMVEQNKLSSSAAKDVLQVVINEKSDPVTVATRLNLLQVSDESELEKIVDDVLNANEKAAQDVAAGEMKAIGFLVGQTMKASGGKANPAVVQQIIKKRLGL